MIVPGLSIEVWLGFVAACVILAATPGPSMSYFVANTASHGTTVGLLSLIGNMLGLSVLVAIAAMGLTSVMSFVAEWFEIIRWIGVAYLCLLGIQKLRTAMAPQSSTMLRAAPTASRVVPEAVFIALSNPKVLLFLGAFFPQFLDLSQPVGPQLIALAISFLIAIAATDFTLILATSRARFMLTRRGNQIADAVSGSVLLGGGILLATLRR